MTLIIDVQGTATQQGSKKGFVNKKTGRVQIVDDNKEELKSWRSEVRDEAKAAMANLTHTAWPLLGPVEVTVIFYMKRPGYHYGSGRNARALKDSVPTFVDKRPDLDKLLRAILDALDQAQVYRDDAQVAVLTAAKEYANGATGARITVAPLNDPTTMPAAAPAGDNTTQEALL